MNTGPCIPTCAIKQPWSKDVTHPPSKARQVVHPFTEMPLRRKRGPYQVVGTEVVWKGEVELHSGQNAATRDDVVPGLNAPVEAASPGTLLPAVWCLQQRVGVAKPLSDMTADIKTCPCDGEVRSDTACAVRSLV